MSKQDIDNLFKRADHLVDTGQLKPAYDLFDQISQLDPENSDAWLMKGSIDGEMGNVDLAISHINKAISIEPDYAEAHYNLARILQVKGDLGSAAEHFGQAHSHDNSFVEALTAAAAINAQRGELDVAEKQAREALSSTPASVDACMCLANVLVQNGQHDEAIAQYNRARELSTTSPPVIDLMIARAYAAQDRDADALDSFKAYLNASPGDIDALYESGVIEYRLGNRDAARDVYINCLSVQPNHKASLVKLIALSHESGDTDSARRYAESAVQNYPDDPVVLSTVAHVLDRPEEAMRAEQLYLHAIDINSEHVQAYIGLLGVYRNAGRVQDSEKLLDRYSSASRSSASMMAMADSLRDNGFYERALAMYSQLESVHDTGVKPAMEQAKLLQVIGHYEESINRFDRVLSIEPENEEALFGKSACFVALGRQNEANLVCDSVLQREPDNVRMLIASAISLMTLSAEDEARNRAHRALSIDPENSDAAALVSTIHEHMGEIEEAYEVLKPFLGDGKLNNVNIAVAFAAVSIKVDKVDNAIKILKSYLDKQDQLTLKTRVNMHFALGKIYDSLKMYDEAIVQYKAGNDIKQADFDRENHVAGIEAVKRYFDADFMRNHASVTVETSKPVFIVGMPRSGTSLVEQILSSHDQVFGAGELPDIIQMVVALPGILETDMNYPECLQKITPDHLDALAELYLEKLDAVSDGEIRVVDKMPGNFMNLGLIELLFPNAKIIHTMRNPVDTCLSCYFQDFSRTHPYSYDMGDLAAFYAGYVDMMNHWKQVSGLEILDIQYEELIADQEAYSRRLIEFCGLEWDEKCLSFYETKRVVSTASYDQVRQPIYNKSVERWRNYESHLQPLVDGLKPYM